MMSRIRVHQVRVGSLTAHIYKEETRETDYSVTLTKEAAVVEFTAEELAHARKALEQAEYFIRFEQQASRMLRCPGCG